MDLTNDQAKALFDAGCFIIFTGLPEGTEVGIDGTHHLIRKFSGFKFVPPGFHSLSWVFSPSSHGGPGIPIRHASFRFFKPRERVVLTYDSASESVTFDQDTLISDDHLRTLDTELAPYPFADLDNWKALTRHIDGNVVQSVIDGTQVMDGLTPVIGEEMERGQEAEKRATDGSGVQFVSFQLRRSWKDGAVGEEVTRFSKDKSWLFGHVVRNQLGGDPFSLLGQMQLAFVLLVHLSSFGALTAYKRFLALFTRSSSLLSDPALYLDRETDIGKLYAAVILAIAAQLRTIPDGSFETELPEFDLFFLEEIQSLKYNLERSSLVTRLGDQWEELQRVGQRWNWGIERLTPATLETEEDSDEEGEYAPVIVEM